MNYIPLDPKIGKPQPGDLVWSALPDAPVVEPRPRRKPFVLVVPLPARLSLSLSVSHR